jgi:integrase
VIRERKKAAASSKQAAQKWAEARERVLLVHGKPKPAKEEVQKIPTLNEFALRFLDGYAKANRLKPSGIASKETVLRVHLAKAFGDKRLDEISTEDVQRLKAALVERAPKTVNNVLTVLSVVLRTAVEWGVIARVPCSIKLLKAPKTQASFHDFAKRQLTVARSEWKGHVTMPKGGRIRYVPLTRRQTDALREARHLRGQRVLCDSEGKPLTQKVMQVMVRRVARHVRPGLHSPRHHVLFAPGDAWSASEGHPGTGRTSGPRHDAAIHAPEPGGARCGDSAVGDGHRNEPRGRGEIVEAAGKSRS